jgi:hypothetical protein
MWNPMETPWLILLISVLLLIGLELARTFVPDKVKFHTLLIPLFLAAVAFGTDYFLKTDHEKIQNAIKEFKHAVINQDIRTLDKLISPSYTDVIHKSKSDIISFARIMLAEPTVEKIKKRYQNMEIEDATAKVTSEFVVHLYSEGYYGNAPPIVFVKFRLYFQKDPEQRWLLSSTAVLEVNNNDFSWSDIKHGY